MEFGALQTDSVRLIFYFPVFGGWCAVGLFQNFEILSRQNMPVLLLLREAGKKKEAASCAFHTH